MVVTADREAVTSELKFFNLFNQTPFYLSVDPISGWKLGWETPPPNTSTQITSVRAVTSQTRVYVLARKRVSGDDLLRQAQLPPQRSDLIFMKILQRFDYFSLQDHEEMESAAAAAAREWGIFLHQIMYEH